MRSKDYYAAIDLGSNSFHMLVVRVVAGSVQVVSKIRRKVRLASGLQDDGSLSAEARQRALDCLAIFADRVRDIAPENITAVGTATLRKLQANDPFLEQVRSTLGHPLRIISGAEEAATIYQGIAHTTAHHGRLLAIDIGGASTELALGHGFTATILRSLDMGCVTWVTRYFADGSVTSENCNAAIAAVEDIVSEHAAAYQEHGWDVVLGASGTFKALQEIATVRRLPERFTLVWLEQLLQETIQHGHFDKLNVHGLKDSRKPTFVSGLCILIGLFRALHITTVEATEGALREGLVYSMLEELQHPDVQLRTLESLVQSYHLDLQQAQRVKRVALEYYSKTPSGWCDISGEDVGALLRAASYLHEIGLALSYQHASSHGHYLLANSNLPGFTQRQREYLLALISSVSGIIDDDEQPESLPDYQSLARLSRLLRLAVLACQRRNDEMIAEAHIEIEGDEIRLQFAPDFMATNPYLQSLYDSEVAWQEQFGGLALLTDSVNRQR
ncbi:guanosine-5'-triphosphate,3'-diphosphate pyrophosphatase [Aliidiomarina haloalkalitolerans]|uniref:Guanosine-5'-triphosphate,3'-diphosphate pyrophosphatase n=1 Tax=Aliidiomarina haloalkalitolerans TaxID=859059 RepID=A0A432VUP0_9GAMM|nr:guanosine-5'-triphosphate,3'-diphosphate pyrophosphatase [Aliidiomarina haloalkalitolerans]RUO20256.1 guanosine-5'-triphosphate,3'-diphosphate pyrophosphatase [Aliidiomarina haloalkalitolerans]